MSITISKALAKLLLTFASDDETRSICGIHVDASQSRATLRATDGHRAIEATVSCDPQDASSFTVPRGRLVAALKGTKATVTVGDSALTSDEGGTVPFSPGPSRDFPRFDQIWPSHENKHATVWGINPAYLADLALVPPALGATRKQPRGLSLYAPETDLDPVEFRGQGCQDGRDVALRGLIMPMRI